jgi:purine-binding chemotaxis protein CheW
MEKGLFLIVSIAGQRVALPADHVESVVEVDNITPVPLVAPHVAGLFALRSRVLTVIDSVAALGLGATPIAGAMQAVIVACDGHHYGLIVDAVEDVVSHGNGIRPLRAALGKGWADAALGVIEQNGAVLLVMDPQVLIAGIEARAA